MKLIMSQYKHRQEYDIKNTKFYTIHNETLTEAEKDFLINLIRKTNNFYGLP